MDKKINDIKRGKKIIDIKELNLDNTQGPARLGLISQFENLQSLSLNNAGLTNLSGFPKLQSLKKLDLASNSLSGGLTCLSNCPNITHLNLSGNKIKDVEALKPLDKLKHLQTLLLVNCDVTKVDNYRTKVFNIINSLHDLDGEDKKIAEDLPVRRTRSSIKKSEIEAKKDEKEHPSPSNKMEVEPAENRLSSPKNDVPGQSKTPIQNVNLPGPPDTPIPPVDVPGPPETASQNEVASEPMETDAPSTTAVANETTSDEPGKTVGNSEKPKKKFRKRRMEGAESSPRKKKKSNFQLKNPLMQLNELKPGLKYRVESQSGPPHEPIFVVSVEVNDQKYIGRGNSKQLAKHAAAQAALASFVQFINMPEAMTAMSRPPSVSDFTTDHLENDGFNFNKFEVHKNGGESEVIISSGNPILKKPMKILTEADKKNPVMLLNEIHPGVSYVLLDENSAVPSQRFRMQVEVNGEIFEGTGQNKRLAKAAAAQAVLCKMYNVSYTLCPAAFAPMIQTELFQFPQPVAENISKLMTSTFNEVMLGNPENAKWKVLAGIAMSKGEDMQDVQVLSFGTGTKCINGGHISMNGATLNDCHAEIISRRCLKDYFYGQLEMHLEGEAEQSIFMKREEGGFALRPHIRFHLYISTAPCGDARVFSPHEEGFDDRHPNRKARGVLRTKIESGEGTIPVKRDQQIQTWDGILSGQQRLLTMSCSDKIASWNILGLQGALLSCFLEPIYLESIILGGLFHPKHLHRALFGRIQDTLADIPAAFKLTKPKMCALTSVETRHLVKSPNFSVNWTVGLGRAEVVNSTTGKLENNQISRLTKRALFQRFLNIYGRVPDRVGHPLPSPCLYASVKSMVKEYQAAKGVFCGAFSKAGLGDWVKKPIEQNEFELTF